MKRRNDLRTCHESDSDKEADFELNKAVKEILKGTDVFPVPLACEVYRIGRKEPGKNRPVKVELACASEVDSVLMRARNLRDSKVFKQFTWDRTEPERNSLLIVNL